MTLQNAFENLSTEAKQDAIITALASLLTELAQKVEPGDLAALATAAKQDIAAGKLDTVITGLSSIDGHVDGLEGKDYATQTTLAATKTVLDSILTSVDGLEANTSGLATQTTAAAILAKLSADPATQTTLEAVRVLLAGTLTVGLPSGAATSAKQDTQATKLDTLHTDLAAVATQTTAAAILAKLTADPATQTTLAAILAKLTSDPATGAAQTTSAGKLDTLHADLGAVATQATLAAMSAKLPAALVDGKLSTKLAWGASGTAVDASATDPLPVVPGVKSTSGTLAGSGQALTLACVGMASAIFAVTAGGSTNINPEFSPDGGTTYFVLNGWQQGTSGYPAINGAGAVALSTGTPLLRFAIPAGATHVRVRATSATSITGTLTISPQQDAIAQMATLTPGGSSQIGTVLLGAGTAQVGFVQAAAIWWDETATPLSGAGTFTGTARSVSASATASASAAAADRGQTEVRLAALADVAGDLYLEISHDSTTFHRIKKVSLAQADGTARFYGEIIHRPHTRFTRLAFVNGAGAQGTFRAFTMHLGG